jgi:hypothetical protein
MLTLALILSITGTAYCVWAGAHPPRKVEAPPPTLDKATQVIVELAEDPPDDDVDPPTVVQTRLK